MKTDLQRRQWLVSLGLGAAGIEAARAQAAAPAADAAAQEAKAQPLPKAGAPLAVPAVELLDGGRFEPGQAQGRVLLLYWWASWCPFCAVTSPHIDKFWQVQRERGLVMLTLSIDKKPDDARAYLVRRGYRWPAAWVSPEVHRALPKPRGLPVTLVRGRDGRVLQAEAGQLFAEDVEDIARHL